MIRKIFLSVFCAVMANGLQLKADTFEPIKYGDFENWVTRNIKESAIIGGNTKQLYEIAPNGVINDDRAYKNQGGSPWATSNIMAKVVGITKCSNAVFPDKRDGGRACKLTTIMEECKALGLINVDVLVAGSIFLGNIIEPIKTSKEPYSKFEMGVPFTRRPKALQFDYKVLMPEKSDRIYSSGFGRKKNYPGHDNAEVYIILQRRWEDADGNIYAKRVGTGRQHFGKSTNGWVNGYQIPVWYGDITGRADYKPFMGLLNGDKCYYARNSKGKMVPINEVGWDSADATPTHLMVMASAGSGTAYIGTIGLTLWIDNVGLVY